MLTIIILLALISGAFLAVKKWTHAHPHTDYFIKIDFDYQSIDRSRFPLTQQTTTNIKGKSNLGDWLSLSLEGRARKKEGCATVLYIFVTMTEVGWLIVWIIWW